VSGGEKSPSFFFLIYFASPNIINIFDELKTTNKMKKVIATSEDTDVMALAQILNEEQVSALLSCLVMLDKVKTYELI
jgi:hypothetical protein